MSAVLSKRLGEIAGYFEKPRKEPIVLNNEGRKFFHEQLVLLRDLAFCMEQELSAFRLIEADRAGRKFLEQEAETVLRTAPVIQEGNVFRPDFGRKS